MKVGDVCLWERYEYVKDCPLVSLVERIERKWDDDYSTWTVEILETGELHTMIEERWLNGPLAEMEVLGMMARDD